MESMENGLFKIFLLEDEPALRNDLREIIEAKLPGAVVFAAGTIEEGLETLRHETGFVVGVVDVRLPAKSGLNPEAHPEVANRLRELHVPAVFITSYRQSPDVLEYLRNRSLVDAPAVVIEKNLNPGKMTSELIAHVRPLFNRHASDRVEACVKKLFGLSVHASGPRSGTAALIAAQRTIAAYWPYLNEPSKQLVRQWFVVSGDAEAVTLSLISEDKC